MYAAMTDYSQSGEQAAILTALASTLSTSQAIDAPQGRFLDIGAFSPKTFSNTRALYELGWHGVLVEPSPGPVGALVKEYGNDDRIAVIAAAVGDEHHIVKFHITNDAVSTTEVGNYELWKSAGGFIGSLWVPMVTVPELLHQFGSFDFVNIDTEGTSFDILKQLLATEMFPRCICVEHDDRVLEITQIATDRGYKVVFASNENVVLSL